MKAVALALAPAAALALPAALAVPPAFALAPTLASALALACSRSYIPIIALVGTGFKKRRGFQANFPESVFSIRVVFVGWRKCLCREQWIWS